MAVSGLFLQVLAFVLGRALTVALPGPNQAVPQFSFPDNRFGQFLNRTVNGPLQLWRTPDNWFWRFINPGPFSTFIHPEWSSQVFSHNVRLDIKEHVAISIMSVSPGIPVMLLARRSRF